MPKVVPEYKQEAKNRIIEAAFQVFSKEGYHQTTMQDIAETLGVSKGALYLYFNSKEELFNAICKRGQEALREVLRSSFKDGDLVENSKLFFDNMLKQSRWTPPLSFEVLSEASRNTALRNVLRQNYGNVLGIVAAFIEQQREKGLIRRSLDTRLLAQGLVALHDGLMTNFILGAKESDVRRAWTETIRAMLYGVLVKR